MSDVSKCKGQVQNFELRDLDIYFEIEDLNEVNRIPQMSDISFITIRQIHRILTMFRHGTSNVNPLLCLFNKEHSSMSTSYNTTSAQPH